MRPLTLAALQFRSRQDRAANEDAIEAMARQAAAQGARLILPPELFAGDYFCIEQHPAPLAAAETLESSRTVARFAALARELGAVIPISFFERAGAAHFNSVAVADSDGRVLGVYRKSHIPDGPGYQEKYFFSPGDTGFRVWETAVGRIGVGICWDQWFPECARAMALGGAELLLYPSAIGSEPPAPDWDSAPHWRRVMQGHAGANLVPLAAVNRIGVETAPGGREVTFYGTSFVCDATGAIVAEAPRDAEAIVTATLDLDDAAALRRSWGLFRDRRPELYGALMTLDGRARAGAA